MKKIINLGLSQQLMLTGNTFITIGSMLISIGSLIALAEKGGLTAESMAIARPITPTSRASNTVQDYFY